MRILAAFFFLLVFARAAGQQPCDCQIAGKASAYNTSLYDLIFLGRVDSVSECAEQATVWFTVSAVYKGEVLKRMPVIYDCSSACKFSFAKGQEWLMYTDYEKYGEAHADVCSRSRRRISNPVLDMYLVSSGQTFEEELAFIDETYHRGQPVEMREGLQPIPDRKNEIPKGWTPLWLIFLSAGGLLLAYFLVRRFWK